MKGRTCILAGLLCAGCVTLTPAQKLSHELFVDAARQCESRYHTIHVDQIDLDGSLKIHADADSRTEYRYFVACYHEELKARAEARRKAGLPVPEALTTDKDVELDCEFYDFRQAPLGAQRHVGSLLVRPGDTATWSVPTPALEALRQTRYRFQYGGGPRLGGRPRPRRGRRDSAGRGVPNPTRPGPP